MFVCVCWTSTFEKGKDVRVLVEDRSPKIWYLCHNKDDHKEDDHKEDNQDEDEHNKQNHNKDDHNKQGSVIRDNRNSHFSQNIFPGNHI